MSISIPVIILSTLTGAANFAVGSFIPSGDETTKNYVSAALGAVSIGAGILTTLGNFFQYAQKSESNRVAGIAWGKFQRLVAVELAINPNDRLDAMDFLKICRQDLDRLIEQSPPISDDVIKLFEEEFKHVPNLKMPDICHGISHTQVFNSSNTRLAEIAAGAALHLRYKKNILANAVIPELDRRIEQELTSRIESRIRELLPNVPDKTIDPVNRIVGLERDWRQLLTTKRNLFEPVITPQNNTKPVIKETRPEEIRINIVGTDGTLPRTPSSRRSVGRLSSRASSVNSPLPPQPVSPSQVIENLPPSTTISTSVSSRNSVV
jgi:hypothetical protein